MPITAPTTVTLHRKWVSAERRFDLDELDAREDSLCIQRELREEERELKIRVTRIVWGLEPVKRHVVSYPANWIEAVKQRFAPKWFTRRWPVKMTEVFASLEETYPEFQQAIPGKKAVMQITVHNLKGGKC